MNNMNKHIIHIVVCLGILVVVVGAFLWFVDNSQEAPSPPVSENETAPVPPNTVATTTATTSVGFSTISTKELVTLLDTTDPYLVNVHIPYDGEIAGTDAFIPYDDITNQLSTLPGKNEPIVLYCRSGRMSEIAARALVAQGYTNVSHLGGGMLDWEAKGQQLIRKDK